MNKNIQLSHVSKLRANLSGDRLAEMVTEGKMSHSWRTLDRSVSIGRQRKGRLYATKIRCSGTHAGKCGSFGDVQLQLDKEGAWLQPPENYRNYERELIYNLPCIRTLGYCKRNALPALQCDQLWYLSTFVSSLEVHFMAWKLYHMGVKITTSINFKSHTIYVCLICVLWEIGLQ